MSDETSNPVAEESESDSSPVAPPAPTVPSELAEPEAVLIPQSADPIAPTAPEVADKPAPIEPIQAEQPKDSPPASNSSIQLSGIDFRARMREAKIRKREARLEKILSFVREKGKITNDEVQKLLRVSDATATRYLRELVNRGLLRKGGATRGVYYFFSQ